jgi:hypothetical protein
MADNKYGQDLHRGSDVQKILEWVEENTNSASAITTEGVIDAMDERGCQVQV